MCRHYAPLLRYSDDDDDDIDIVQWNSCNGFEVNLGALSATHFCMVAVWIIMLNAELSDLH